MILLDFHSMKNYFSLFFVFLCFSSNAQYWHNNGAFTQISSTTTFKADYLKITSGTVANAGTVTLSANLNNSGTLSGNGTYNVAGNWANDGTFTSGTSTVVFNGGAAQTIGGTTTPTTFNNITINNSSGGVSLSADEKLKGTLTLTSGAFSTVGKIFTLISDVSGTARVAQITGGSFAVGSEITMQRYITGNDGWRMLGSPVGYSASAKGDIEDWNTEFTMSGFTGTEQPTSTFISVKSYNEATAGDKNTGFVTPSNTTDALVEGQGYLAWIGDALGASITKTIDLTGPPYTGTRSLPVTYNDDAGQPATEDGWNIVCNLFPSTIDWDASSGWTARDNMNLTKYTWNDANNNFASYTVGGANTNGGTRYIPSMQGFWVQTSASSPALTHTEAVKVSNDVAFLKQIPPGEISLRLKISGQTGFSDEALIRFMPNATTGFEGDKDAFKLFTLSPIPPGISTVSNESFDMCVNSYPELTSNTIFPIRTKTHTSQNCSVSLTGLDDIPSNFCVLLEDNQTGTITDFRNDTAYAFFLADTTLSPRFSLHLLKNDSISCSDYLNILSDLNPSIPLKNQMYITSQNGKVNINFDLPAVTNASISLYDMLGQNIVPEKKYSVFKNKIELNVGNYSRGIYLLHIVTDQQNLSQKVLIK